MKIYVVSIEFEKEFGGFEFIPCYYFSSRAKAEDYVARESNSGYEFLITEEELDKTNE